MSVLQETQQNHGNSTHIVADHDASIVLHIESTYLTTIAVE
jgi:hypothetical protein